ncbi:MAG: serine protease [Treponema sp.]|jgi:S1-C subfamily serine protease|nr:serine protease [Treponema sp.]
MKKYIELVRTSGLIPDAPVFLFVVTGIFVSLVFSCASAAPVETAPAPAPVPAVSASAPETAAGTEAGISSAAFRLVRSAVFEVVIEKPREDPVSYERELDWESVPYAIRSDKYYSIGTAFAISERELISAFHVINLGFKSMVYEKYCIRDARGNVYEIDNITGGSDEQDFIIFTVKGRSFSEYFRLERNFEAGDPVYSVGNALGEGIVVRNGLILGTVPEQESGRWNLLKSSADGNPGNSGGPLVRPDGTVIALVTALRDNILYSLPVDVILNTPRDRLQYRRKYSYGHLLLANNMNRVFETSAPLPADYRVLRDKITADYGMQYKTAMTDLFGEAPPYLAPENSAYLFNASLSSVFPELDFVDKNDNNWKLSKLDRKTYNLPNDGTILHASVSGFNFYKINKPKSVELEQLISNPRQALDLILQYIRTERTLWGNDKYRILSFGDPASVTEYRDVLGRTWVKAHWLIGFDDKVLIMYILPLPNGPAVISTIQSSSMLNVYEWDIEKTCDHIHTAYSATFNEWKTFIGLQNYIPRFLRNMEFNWQEAEQKLIVNSAPYHIAADKQVFNWSGISEFFLAPSWYSVGGTTEYAVRKIIIYCDSRGKESVLLYKNIKPDPVLGTNALEFWNDLRAEKFPFDGKPAISVKDNTGSMGVILTAEHPLPDVIYYLYLSMENPLDEENLSRRFNALKSGIGIQK